MNITKHQFPEAEYFKEEHPKKIIVIHHTASGNGIEGDINWWKKDPQRVGTPFIIDREGNIHQVFDEKYWIHHLGIQQQTLKIHNSQVSNNRLNQLSIAIELDSWGGLVKRGEKYYSYTGAEVPKENVIEYPTPYRGFKYFEKYTPAQIKALKELLQHLIAKWGIPKEYNANMFEFNAQAVRGTHGIWTHSSYRPDKNDCHPQPELIEMLKSL